MKNVPVFFAIIIIVSIISCTTSEPEKAVGPLEGVWELVSGEWSQGDSITSFPSSELSGKSIKYYSGSYFFVIGEMGMKYSLSGTYSVEENKCVEVIGLNSAGMSPGEEAVITFVVEDDILKLESDWFKESWKRIE